MAISKTYYPGSHVKITAPFFYNGMQLWPAALVPAGRDYTMSKLREVNEIGR